MRITLSNLERCGQLLEEGREEEKGFEWKSELPSFQIHEAVVAPSYTAELEHFQHT